MNVFQKNEANAFEGAVSARLKCLLSELERQGHLVGHSKAQSPPVA